MVQRRPMKKAAAQQGVDLERFDGLEPDDVRREREEQWEERLLALAQAEKINLDFPGEGAEGKLKQTPVVQARMEALLYSQ